MKNGGRTIRSGGGGRREWRFNFRRQCLCQEVSLRHDLRDPGDDHKASAGRSVEAVIEYIPRLLTDR